MTAVYLKCIDKGTDNECWVVCAKGDLGAVLFIPYSSVERKTTVRDDEWHSTGQPVPYKPADGQW